MEEMRISIHEHECEPGELLNELTGYSNWRTREKKRERERGREGDSCTTEPASNSTHPVRYPLPVNGYPPFPMNNNIR